MIDPELEAIFKCTELLKDLDDEQKIRVLQYLINRFKLTPAQQTIYSANVQQAGNNSGQLPAPLVDNQNNGSNGFDDQKAKTVFNSTYPSMRDIAAKDLPKSEIEWVLIYCFYSSEYGEKDFTRTDIISLYETSKRKTQQALNNLTLNMTACIKKDWIKSLNDKDFIILDAGKTYAIEVLNGKSTTKARKVGKRKTKDETPSES